MPPLTNRGRCFAATRTCACGQRFALAALTHDHVLLRAHGGADVWENVATACGPCNLRKGERTLDQGRTPLLAVPYAPDMAEWLLLSNCRIPIDQIRFLQLG